MRLDLPLATLCLAAPCLAFIHLAYLRLHTSKQHGQEQHRSVSLASSTRTWLTRLLPLFALLGLLAALIAAAHSSHVPASWLLAAAWLLAFGKTVTFFLQRLQSRRYVVTLWLSLSGLLLSWAQLTLLLAQQPSETVADRTTIPSYVGTMSALLLLLVPLWCVPRTGVVHFRGAIVDGLNTCSIIDWISFSWALPLLRLARSKSALEYSDLPLLEEKHRSATLFPGDDSKSQLLRSPGRPLWQSIFREHYRAYLRQWAIGIVRSLLMIVPPICLYNILALMEASPSDSITKGRDIVKWIVALGVSKLAHATLNAWTDFAALSLCAIRVRVQLSAIIFRKSLQTKIVAEDGPSATKSSVDAADASVSQHEQAQKAGSNESSPLLGASTDDESSTTPSECAESKEKTPPRGLSTLIAVDVARIEGATRYIVEVWQGIVEGLLATVFLVRLLGWWSTLAGLAMPVLLYPLNRLCFVKYVQIQEMTMKIRDRKQHAISEAYNGIRQIKFSASEASWEKALMAIRNQEYDIGWTANSWIIPLFIMWRAMPIMMAGASLSVFAILSREMSPSTIFTALSVFATLEMALATFPMAIGCLVDALVSATRIEEYLASEERKEVLDHGENIEFENATIAWPASEDSLPMPVLKDVNLRFPRGVLSVVEGKTGSGKSLLLAGVIGEADILAGNVRTPQISTQHAHRRAAAVTKHDQMAFVSQVPWLENASLRDNILFGSTYNQDRYRQVLYACALDADLDTLQDGDHTEVGASGINLSGGQKWRVALARALYSQAGILVLDDIFSAVDAHVGRHLLINAILGDISKDRTIIIATHHAILIERYASFVVRLNDGHAEGSMQEPLRITPSPTTTSDAGDAEAGARKDEKQAQPDAKKFVEDETRQQGRVPLGVYLSYLKSGGGWLYWAGIFLTFVLFAALSLGRTYWVAIWTSQYELRDSRVLDNVAIGQSSQVDWRMYLGVYGFLSLLSVLLLGFQFWAVSINTLGAASEMFSSALHNVLRARMRWLDTQPLGRILNRFVSDFMILDTRVGVDIAFFVGGVFSASVIMVSALFASLWMLIPVAVITAGSIYVTALFLDAARDLRRLESTAKSPILNLISSTLSGLATIRCFGRVDDFMQRMHECLDRAAQTTWHLELVTSWVRFRQGLLGTILVVCVTLAVVYLDSISASIAGFAISFALQFSDVVELTIRQYAEIEMDMNFVERVLEYSNLETEPSGGKDVPASWPAEGMVQFEEVEVAYAKDLPSVLKGVSFTAEPRQRIGIVGRTGSGKSSLTLSLFRFLELRHGSITIDGVDIADVKLQAVRNRMTIIPQDPVLFSGTLRSNLDPFDKYDDEVLFQALRRVHLLNSPFHNSAEANSSSKNVRFFNELSSTVSDSGSNLSQGQKQLLCLARALITKPKILVLDEATSAVDTATDVVIQRAIREEFPETTLLVIAHRLSTVKDFDKILVLDQGRVAEFDEPEVLLEKEDGLFRGMLEKAG